MKILNTALIPLNTLLLFFVLFESKLTIPLWLQVFGRMHPLALHFPIVLLILLGVLVLVVPAARYRQEPFSGLLRYLLLFTALAAVITALMGVLLSVGGDYPAETIIWHKWTGVVIPAVLALLSFFWERLVLQVLALRMVILGACILLVLAGHYGSTLTHGENFVLAPLTEENERKLPSFEEALLFADLVQPIFEEKCISCHSASRAKGGLVMETKASLLKGGKNGRSWDTTKADYGIMMRRIHLPPDQKKHMPPAGKPQLTAREMAVLEYWIREGARFDMKVADLSPDDSIYIWARSEFSVAAAGDYSFLPPDEREVARLSNSSRVIKPVAEGSPALSVHFFNADDFRESAVEELLPLKDNITDMSFSGMPVRDRLLPVLAQFKELRKLNLNRTGLTGSTLSALTALPVLKTLSLAGTGVVWPRLTGIGAFPSLQEVFLWNTPVTQEHLLRLEKEHPKVLFNLGFEGDSTVLQLSPPRFAAESDVFRDELPVTIRHFIKGAHIRYTTDGSDPDSLHSPEYRKVIVLNRNTMLKAKAFKKGWSGSDVARHYYFRKTFAIDSAELVIRTKLGREVRNARMLIDDDKSDINFTNGKWLIFAGKPMECLLFFNKPVKAANFTLGILKDISASIMPPQKVEVWGGRDAGHLRLLSSTVPAQPREMEYREVLPVECNFAPTELRVIKVVAYPLATLPSWHQNKGSAASLYVDEVFVN